MFWGECKTNVAINFLHSYTGKENIQTQVFVNNGYFDCELIMVRPKKIRRGKFKGVGHWVMPGGQGHLEHRQMPPLNTPRINCTVHKIQPQVNILSFGSPYIHYVAKKNQL